MGLEPSRAGVALVCVALVPKRCVRHTARSRTPFRIRVGSFSLAGVGPSRSLTLYWSPRALAYSAGPGASQYWVVVKSPSPREGIRRWVSLREAETLPEELGSAVTGCAGLSFPGIPVGFYPGFPTNYRLSAEEAREHSEQ